MPKHKKKCLQSFGCGTFPGCRGQTGRADAAVTHVAAVATLQVNVRESKTSPAAHCCTFGCPQAQTMYSPQFVADAITSKLMCREHGLFGSIGSSGSGCGGAVSGMQLARLARSQSPNDSLKCMPGAHSRGISCEPRHKVKRVQSRGWRTLVVTPSGILAQTLWA